ncbi:MAG: hypothetical protein ACPIOQ_46475, partial [Promethearchaeia archaeon]
SVVPIFFLVLSLPLLDQVGPGVRLRCAWDRGGGAEEGHAWRLQPSVSARSVAAWHDLLARVAALLQRCLASRCCR